jgi:hypothetical protein
MLLPLAQIIKSLKTVSFIKIIETKIVDFNNKTRDKL